MRVYYLNSEIFKENPYVSAIVREISEWGPASTNQEFISEYFCYYPD